MNRRWHLVMLPSVLVSIGLLIASQAAFLRMSVYQDRGFGLIGTEITLANYRNVLSDPFYLGSLGLTFEVALLAVGCSLLVGYPVAYALTRMKPALAGVVIAAIVATALVAEVIKVLGLIVLFSNDGPINRTLIGAGLVGAPIRVFGTVPGVVLGVLHFTFGFAILLIYSVLRTIPRSLEDAANVHGANPARTFWRVVLPLSMPGVIATGLVTFNMSMGAFTAASLIGGGRILTLPVLIERTIILETKYSMAATLSAVLLAVVLLINAGTVLGMSRLRFAAMARGVG